MARPRTPTALKLVKGTAQPCRTNKREPKPIRAIPACPEHLSDKAKVAWGTITILLDRMGVLTEADVVALEGACEALADLRAAREALKAKVGLSYETTTQAGDTMYRPHPEIAMIQDADRRLIAWLTKFGMTPADRSRVSALEEKQTDPWSKI